MAGLVPAIHVLLGCKRERRGCPQQVRAWRTRDRHPEQQTAGHSGTAYQRVYARLRRAMGRTRIQRDTPSLTHGFRIRSLRFARKDELKSRSYW